MNKDDKLLAGVTAVNAASGLVAAIIGKMLGDLGATVFRPAGDRPDPASSLYPAYDALRGTERPVSAAATAAILTTADLLILGGEDVQGMPSAELPARDSVANPKLVRLCIAGYPNDRRPAVDTLVQARAGLTFEHIVDRANLMPFHPASYGAAFQGLIGALAALVACARGQSGQDVTTSLHQGALAWVTTWATAERPTPAFRFATPFDPRPLILRCASSDYIHIVMGSSGSKYHLYRILGIDDASVLPGDAGLPSKDDPPEKFYGDVELIAPYVAQRDRAELLDELAAAGIIAAPVLDAGDCWDDRQVLHDGMIEPLADGGAIIGPPAGIRIALAGGRPPAWIAPPASGRPLAGVRIIDFGAFTAGPLASLALSRLGADVIKVEPPGGDPCRNLTRAFMAANRGKRSIAVDMKCDRGRDVALALCASADIVVSNFRTGVSRKMGIDPETLLAKFPHLIVLECPAFGNTGPRAAEVAFDPLMQAFCGFETRAGGTGNTPLWNRSFLADYGGGQIGSITLLAALHHRQRTGRGCAVDVSLLRAAMVLQSETIRLANGSFAGAEPLDHERRGRHAADSLYRTSDGWIAIVVRDPGAAGRLAALLEVDELPRDWQAWGPQHRDRIAAACANRHCATLHAALDRAGICAEICHSGMEERTLTDPTLLRAGIVEVVETPGLGRVSHVGSLFHLSGSPAPSASPAPAIGEHDAEILSELGYDAAAVDGLIETRVIGAARPDLWQ